MSQAGNAWEPVPAQRGPFDLGGQRALVTGAARGLGREIALALAAAGAHVLLNGRAPPALDVVADEIRRRGGEATPLPFDVADPRAVAGVDLQDLDILVNNVGGRDRRPLSELDPDALRRLLDLNLVAPFSLSQRAAAGMVRRGRGRIINVTSIAGPLARSGDAAYTSAKGALAALTRALAAELGPHGVTANAVAPGYFATEANAAMVADPEVADWLGRRTSLGRWGRPEEIGGAVVFLASPAAAYITGHTLFVDGGYAAHF